MAPPRPSSRTPAPPPPRALTDRDHPLLAEAIQLWNRHEFERSLFTYERAMAADPGNARITINAARAFFRRNQPAKGAAMLQSLIHAMPEEPRVHHMVGETLRLMSLPVAAIAAFEDARRLGDRSSKAALELAALYEQAGQLDPAERLVESVLAEEPGSLWAGLLQGQLLARRKHHPEAEHVYRSVIARAEPRSEIACQAWAELAGLLDAAGDAPRACDAIERCKAPQRAADGPAWRAAQHVAERFGRMIAEIGPEQVRAWSERAGSVEEGQPHRVALLGGFPRSGTTLLEQVVDAHPGVCSVEERDVLAGEIFPTLVHGHPPESPIVPILSALGRKQIARIRDRYLTALRDWSAAAGRSPDAGVLMLDKNPGATPLIPVLRALVTSAPLLIAIRDPRDVVLSCYLRHLRLNPLSVNFLTIERAAAKYAMDMGAWLRFRELYAGGGGWIEVKYEDLVSDLEGVARRVLDTLGLTWDASVLGYRERLGAKVITSPTYASVQEPVTRKAVGRWIRYEKLLAPALPTLEPIVRAFGYT